MYGQVCETGGTREVLPPRPLNVSRLRICLNLKIDFVRSGQTLGLNDCYKQDQRSSTERKIVLQETYAAQDCAAGWRFYMCASGDIYL